MKKKLKEAETNIPVQPDSWTVGQHNLIAFSLQLINWRHALKACHCLVEVIKSYLIQNKRKLMNKRTTIFVNTINFNMQGIDQLHLTCINFKADKMHWL